MLLNRSDLQKWTMLDNNSAEFLTSTQGLLSTAMHEEICARIPKLYNKGHQFAVQGLPYDLAKTGKTVFQIQVEQAGFARLNLNSMDFIIECFYTEKFLKENFLPSVFL